MAWVILIITILLEVFAGVITRLYIESNTTLFYLLILPVLSLVRWLLFAQVIRPTSGIELSHAYAFRYGLSIALITIIGIWFFRESFTWQKVLYMSLIVVGVVGLNLGGVKSG